MASLAAVLTPHRRGGVGVWSRVQPCSCPTFLRNIVRATSFSRARVNALQKRARLDLAGIVASGPSHDNVDLADRSLARLKGDECSDLPGRMNSGVMFVLSTGSRSLSQRGHCDRFSSMLPVAGSAFLSPSFFVVS